MPSKNFLPLKHRWPQLFDHGSFAEGYTYTDPHTAIIKLRCFAENVVGILYRELNLPSKPTDGFFEKLKAEVFQNIVDAAVIQKLHAIRMMGNKAAHGRSVDIKDAVSLIKEAYLIGQWLYKAYSGETPDDYPSYTEPLKPADQLAGLKQAKEQLAKQLAAAKEELELLGDSEKASQEEISAHNQSLDQVKLEAFKKASSLAASTIDFEVKNTRRLISMHDAFAEYTLNDGQAEIVNRLDQFISSKKDNVFLLKGYAGTGKTFITKGLTEYFRAIGRNYVLAAPTGKASKVIANKTKSPAYTIHKTIYSFDDIAEYQDDDIEGTETFKFYAQLSMNGFSADTVYIVDEASMISDIYQEAEFFRFGSGYLLTDFLKFVNLDHNDHSKKIIFIGDDAQLPPIGMNFSPALNTDYLLRKHNVRSTGFELTEVVRQKAESGVIWNAIQLRKALHTGVFNQIDVDLNYPDVTKVEYQNLIPRYLETCDEKINGESIVIAHSNSDVADYNHRIREHFFPGSEELVPGDKVMAVANNNFYGIFISNGDFGLIRQVLGKPEKRTITLKRKISNSNKTEEIPVPLVFRNVVIGFKDLEGLSHFFQAKIIEELLYNKEPGLSSDQNKALYLDFCIRNKDLPKKSMEFKHALKSDPYFNALRLKFGYAITCHKAQGSEWNHVFVKCKNHQSQLTAEYFRWFYTAITRTSQKLHLLDPPHLKIGARIKIVENPGVGLNLQPEQEEDLLATRFTEETSPQQVPDVPSSELETFGIPESSPFLLAILHEVRKLISDKGIVIDSITHNQYQEVYSFNHNNDSARIDIRYNGKSKVTSVNDPLFSEFGAELTNLFTTLKGRPMVVGPVASGDQFRFEQQFLNDFHGRVVNLADARGITIQNVVEQQWSQRYTFTMDREVAVYDVYYNSKNQLTKCQPLITACSPGPLVGEVGLLLTEGLTA
ncbi:MAG: AAA family ATPase [Desulfobacterium sp.]|nr:AAA family ATPase [Desulfobacterium sp.]